MTNQQLASITAEERADLIADCKSDIDFFTMEINKFAMKKLPPSVMAKMQRQLKRQQIALAALTAEPVVKVTDVNIHNNSKYWQAKQLATVNMNLLGYTLYAAPPVPVLKPIDLSACKKLWYDHDDLSHEIICIPVKEVKKAIRAAEYEVKS